MADRARSITDAYDECDKVDTLFIVFCITICWIIIPALGLGYSGYSTRKSGLASFYPSILSIAVCSLQWWAIGYTLTYSNGNGFIGDFTYVFHRNVLSEPVGSIPAIIFSQFQLVFEATVCAIVVGGFCERGRLIAVVPYIVLWSTLIYDPLAHMVWQENGFLYKLGVMDFAGGTPVHICSGASATAISVYLSWPICRSRKSKIRTPGHLALHKPQNTMNQILALMIIWSSWIAFEAGTALSLNFRAVYAVATTNLCAAAGSTTWALITYYETGEWSVDSFFMGAIAGLVMITPGGGFFSLTSSLFLGAMSAFLGRQFLRIKFTDWARRWRWVDNGDTFATHFCLGIIATISTGLFGLKEVAAYDGVSEIAGGVFFDGHVGQVGIQLVEAVIGITYSFTMSYLIMCLIDSVPGFEVLAVDEEVMKGMDCTMAESLSDSHWQDEKDYVPLSKRIEI